jgi:hypothetical protein
MKKLLYILIFIPYILQAQRELPINYSMDIKGNVRTDTVKTKNLKFSDGSIQKTAYDSIKVASQLGDSLDNIITGEAYLGDSAQIKTDIRNLQALTDTTSELVARTIYVSMPTDPQTPGSDVTGNGSISTPYATIYKALLSIKTYSKIYSTITIQLDSGSYFFKIKEKMLLMSLSNRSNIYYSSNPIEILGTYKLNNSYNLTLSQATPFISRITSTALTSGELNDRFLGSASGPTYAIESNKTDTIFSISQSASYNKVYDLLTTLQLDNASSSQDLYFSDLPTRGFRYLYITVSATNLYIGGVFLRNSIVDNTNTEGTIIINHSRITMVKFKCKKTATATSMIIIARACQITGAIFYNTGTRKTTGYGISVRDLSQLTACIFSGFLHAFEFLNPINSPMGAQSGAVFFKDNGICYSNGLNYGCSITANTDQIVVYNSDYMFRTYSANSGINFTTNQLFGNITIFDPNSLVKSAVNPSNGTVITGLVLYPEYQQKQTTTLANNSTDSISIADKSYNRSVELKLNIVRGTGYQSKTIKLLNTGTTFNMVQLPDSIQTGDLGVRFDGVYQSGNSNTLKLKWRTTSTGTNATVTYDAYRQNY